MRRDETPEVEQPYGLQFDDGYMVQQGKHVYNAEPTDAFWKAWRKDKQALKDAGYAVGKYEGDWEVSYWAFRAKRTTFPIPVDVGHHRVIRDHAEALEFDREFEERRKRWRKAERQLEREAHLDEHNPARAYFRRADEDTVEVWYRAGHKRFGEWREVTSYNTKQKAYKRGSRRTRGKRAKLTVRCPYKKFQNDSLIGKKWVRRYKRFVDDGENTYFEE